MQPQAQPQQQATLNPSMPPQMQAEAGVKPQIMATQETETEEEPLDMVAMIEERMEEVPDEHKAYLLEALKAAPDVVTNVLGIINGPEVQEYFIKLYQTHFQNSGQEQAPQQAAQQPNAGVSMAPMSQPSGEAVMNTNQARDTAAPMV